MNRGALTGLLATALAFASACTTDNPAFVNPADFTPCDTGQLVIEPFDLAVPNRVDILFVVDNGPGTDLLQAALSQAMPHFVQALDGSDLDYHLGVVSTDIVHADQQGRLQTGVAGQSGCPGNRSRIITRDTAGAATTAACNVVLGQGGDAYPAGLEAVRYALIGPAAQTGGVNDGFLRADARLVVVIVSNHTDCSDDGSLQRQDPNECEWDQNSLIGLDTYYSFFDQIRPNAGNPVDVVALVGPDDGFVYQQPEEPQPVCASNGTAFNGRRYIDVVDHLKAGRGGFYNVCTRGYEPLLNEIFDQHVLPRPEQVCPLLHLTQEPVSVRMVGGSPEHAVPVPNGPDGYLYLGPSDECDTGRILVAPGVSGTLGDNERLEVHYCTADPIPQ